MRRLLSIACVVNFERVLYQTAPEHLTKEFVIATAKDMSLKYFDLETPDLFPLLPVHIYARENACSYHGYGIAELAVHQRRKYRYEKDGHIVDNPAI